MINALRLIDSLTSEVGKLGEGAGSCMGVFFQVDLRAGASLDDMVNSRFDCLS